MFTAELLTRAQRYKQHKHPPKMNRRPNYSITYNGVLLHIKRNDSLIYCEHEVIMLSDVSNTKGSTLHDSTDITVPRINKSL